jgi:hypothetical protein
MQGRLSLLESSEPHQNGQAAGISLSSDSDWRQIWAFGITWPAGPAFRRLACGPAFRRSTTRRSFVRKIPAFVRYVA